ncbi:transposase [Hirsutella rhossiliensis]|uniref:Transposase n=1 Tax=Hirsutella rhossiliensis TaxID=111463 RepID=A0A9P8SFD2_9HYPO|nr:transposase [Hirsutella rhossiliensis]KAH0959315.1 transposase [Hirsutella rhossiliensis]
MLGITCKEVPIEAHWSIGKVERYHGPLRRAFEIMYAELSSQADADSILQMAVKAVNDTAGPDGLVPTLLVFGAYPRITADSPPNPSVIRRGEVVRKAMKELRKFMANRDVKEALGTRNGPTTIDVLNLKLQSEPYYKDDNSPAAPGTDEQPRKRGRPLRSTNAPAAQTTEPAAQTAVKPPTGPRKRGRPPGSKNKKHSLYNAQTFLQKREMDDIALAIKLRDDGVITTPGAPFEQSDQKINDLIGRGVFTFELFDPTKHRGTRIFKSRLVREVKGKYIKPYESLAS